jgi:hypothetical protein
VIAFSRFVDIAQESDSEKSGNSRKEKIHYDAAQ